MLSENKIQILELFFRDPADTQILDPNHSITPYSSLYRLRKDAIFCLNETCDEKAPWAAATVICVGIDLLGQYYLGNIKSKVLKRYEDFCTKYLGTKDDQATSLFYLRNAFTHNYGLLSESGKGNLKFKFIVDYDKSDPELFQRDEFQDDIHVCKINLFSLHERFKKAINDYYKDLLENAQGEFTNFEKVLSTYQLIGPDTYTNSPNGSAIFLIDDNEIFYFE